MIIQQVKEKNKCSWLAPVVSQFLRSLLETFDFTGDWAHNQQLGGQ